VLAVFITYNQQP